MQGGPWPAAQRREVYQRLPAHVPNARELAPKERTRTPTSAQFPQASRQPWPLLTTSHGPQALPTNTSDRQGVTLTRGKFQGSLACSFLTYKTGVIIVSSSWKEPTHSFVIINCVCAVCAQHQGWQ